MQLFLIEKTKFASLSKTNIFSVAKREDYVKEKQPLC